MQNVVRNNGLIPPLSYCTLPPLCLHTVKEKQCKDGTNTNTRDKHSTVESVHACLVSVLLSFTVCNQLAQSILASTSHLYVWITTQRILNSAKLRSESRVTALRLRDFSQKGAKIVTSIFSTAKLCKMFMENYAQQITGWCRFWLKFLDNSRLVYTLYKLT